MFSPLIFLLGWLVGPLSLAALGFSLYFLWEWVRRAQEGQIPVLTEAAGQPLTAPPLGLSAELAMALAAASALWLLWSLFGRYAVLAFFRKGEDEPRSLRASPMELTAGDGVRLHVEMEGPRHAPALILTHGWGLDSTAWYYLRKQLAGRFRLVTWDLPGLGRSRRPAGNDFSVENLVNYQRTVIEAVPGPVLLVGHSIGGMMTFTLCRRFPELMRGKVAGAVLMNTTYTQPLRTIMAGPLLRALEYPVLRPLLYLTIALAPLVWLWSWLSYWNGGSHLLTRYISFSRAVTRGQLDFAASFMPRQNPAVLARGLLALLRWDEAASLRHIALPIALISGADDRITLPAASEAMKRELPSANLTQVAPAGHAGLLEQGRQYAQAVQEFAAQLPQAPPAGAPPRPAVPAASL